MPDQPRRIQRSRAKGWRMPAGAVYVGRPTLWGNPFTIASAIETGFARDEEKARGFVVDCYRDWLTERGARTWWDGKEAAARRAAILDNLHQLRGHDLVCWCPLDCPCHAAVLLELANA